MAPRSAAAIVAALADALQHAHAKGVIHRDLKPANILLEGVFPDSLDAKNDVDIAIAARISDFGLAKTQDDGVSLTGEGGIVGTPAYMPPEQANGGTATVRSDIYSLGAILYQLLTGRPPHTGVSILEVLRSVNDDFPEAPARSHPQVPRDLDAICMRCLDKLPDKRYPSAMQLHDDLQNFLQARPVTARRATWLENSWRWCRRNPKLATALTAVFVSVMLGIGLFGYQYRRTMAANKEYKSTLYFLTHTLNSSNPSAKGHKVTIGTMLNERMEVIRREASLSPEIRGTTAMSIGISYLGLGQYDGAIDAFEFAQALWANEPDSDENRILNEGQLGIAYTKVGRVEEAIPMLEKAAEKSRSELGSDHVVTRNLKISLAEAYSVAGSKKEFALATELYESAQSFNSPLEQQQIIMTYADALRHLRGPGRKERTRESPRALPGSESHGRR